MNACPFIKVCSDTVDPLYSFMLKLVALPANSNASKENHIVLERDLERERERERSHLSVLKDHRTYNCSKKH